MKTNNILLLFIALVVAISYGCSPVKVVSTEFDPQAASGNYKTYNFYDLSVDQDYEKIKTGERFEMLKDAVARELEAVGLTKSDNPDLKVNIGVVVEEKEQTRETTLQDAPRYMGQRNYHWESEEVVVGHYKQGTVTIDLVDATTNKLVGQSVGTGVIVENDENLKQRIDAGVAKMFDSLWKTNK